MEAFKIIYTVLGGLGIFFYGMKSMSEALQSVAGDAIKSIINTMTKNRVYAVLVGTVVTVLVQSSSVTTVMVVGFVNAGLMNLTQAIGIIFGANVGTTITGWIISIKVGKYGLLFIGLGIFPMLFAKRNNWRQIGRILFGIGMIFFGLKLMSDAFKPLRGMPEFLDAISYFSEQNYGSYIASILVGCLLTIVVQSSSAMLGITMSLAMTGVIEFHTAAALVLGENIGTTVTALLASVGGNIMAKRTARAHATFNLLGVAVIFCFFPYYVELIDWIVPGNPNLANAEGEFSNMGVHIATGHTIFNVAATIIFLPFLRTLAAIVVRFTPDNGIKEQHHLVMLGSPRDMVPATALTTARAETNKLKGVVDRAFNLTEELFSGKLNEKEAREAVTKINRYEKSTDNIQKEITIFLVQIQEMSLSQKESLEGHSLTRVADEFESICDYLDTLARYTEKMPIKNLLKGDAGDEFFTYFREVREFYDLVANQFFKDVSIDLSTVSLTSDTLKQKSYRIRDKHLEEVGKGSHPPLSALTYSDMIMGLRKVRSHTQNLALAHQKSKEV
jgi:phosphate:Na+ symporter